MKTKILLIGVLIFAGWFFTSCQKDNSLLEEQGLEQDAKMQLVAEKPGNTIDANLVNSDPLTHYPEPFQDMTFIEYKVPYPTWVTIIVYNRKEGFSIRLVSDFLHEGVYRIEFDARDLPPGKYVAEMRIGNKVIREDMTKVFKSSLVKIPKKS